MDIYRFIRYDFGAKQMSFDAKDTHRTVLFDMKNKSEKEYLKNSKNRVEHGFIRNDFGSNRTHTHRTVLFDLERG